MIQQLPAHQLRRDIAELRLDLPTAMRAGAGVLKRLQKRITALFKALRSRAIFDGLEEIETTIMTWPQRTHQLVPRVWTVTKPSAGREDTRPSRTL